MSIDNGKKIEHCGRQASYFESRGALTPINLKNLVGAGITLPSGLSVTSYGSDYDNHFTAINDGTYVTISGAFARADNYALVVGTYGTLFTLTTASGSSGDNAESRLLKPAAALVDVDAKQETIDAGTAGTGVTAGKTYICGDILSMTPTATTTIPAGGGTCAMGMIRIRCSAANTYVFEYISSAAVGDSGGAVAESCIFKIRYPVQPRDAIALA